MPLVGEIVFSKEEYINRLPDLNDQPRKCVQGMLYRWSKLYFGIHMNIIICMKQQLMERGHGFEREQGGLYGRF